MERWVIRLRLRLSSYGRMAASVPDTGQILDLGCGFGLFSVYLAVSSNRRCIRGVDISQRRIMVARTAARNIKNISFSAADMVEIRLFESDCILLIDVLHYFPEHVQKAILRKCASALKQGGTLLIRAPDTTRGLRYRITWLHEILMIRLGFTRGARLHFMPVAEMGRLVGRLGFEVHLRPMWGRTPFADTLIICHRKTAIRC
jgi:2-polyprenyl-3-methyl-5-hydroxy-6-metoxy-1,4-benzoquinol methylase